MMKTYSPKPSELTHDWFIVDASTMTLGRLATVVATYLLGKHKPQFSPHLDCGDNIVVINASDIKVTGAKLEAKRYYRHSGYPGGIKEIDLATQLRQHPAVVIEKAVAGMLPKNRLHDDRLRRLKVYPSADHPHGPQNPKVLGESK
jgi:large subunit ribosomal protein L13